MNTQAKAALAEYRRKVASGELPKPIRKKGVRTLRTTGALDGSFGPERGKRLIVTLDHSDTITLRPERTRRAEVLHLIDVYRLAVRARVNREASEKRAARKAKRQGL